MAGFVESVQWENTFCYKTPCLPEKDLLGVPCTLDETIVSNVTIPCQVRVNLPSKMCTCGSSKLCRFLCCGPELMQIT